MTLDSGITADVSSGAIRWDTHDIDLDGTALEWAVGTRNRPLVSCLIPHSSPEILTKCLGLATARFFWDIAEELIPHLSELPPMKLPDLFSARFFPYIAHGPDLGSAIEKTVQLRRMYKMIGNYGDDITHLQSIAYDAVTPNNIRLLEVLLSVLTPDEVKANPDAFGPLVMATVIGRVESNSALRPVLDTFLDFYSPEELDKTEFFPDDNFLSYAV